MDAGLTAEAVLSDAADAAALRIPRTNFGAA
jgi:hypothetical protein